MSVYKRIEFLTLDSRHMYYDFLDCEYGVLYIESTIKGIRSVKLIDQEYIHMPRPNHFTTMAIQELSAYFQRQLEDFKVPVDISEGTAFQKNVWNALIHIPYGRTTTYLNIARKLGNPKAVRAVGLANGQNPIPIIIPCHRVIGSDGSLVGYALGIELKEKLLCLENPVAHGRQAELF